MVICFSWIFYCCHRKTCCYFSFLLHIYLYSRLIIKFTNK